MNKNINLSNYCVSNILVKEIKEYYLCAYEKEMKGVQTSKHFEIPTEFIDKIESVEKDSSEEKALIEKIIAKIKVGNDDFEIYDESTTELVRIIKKSKPFIGFDYTRDLKSVIKYAAPVLCFNNLKRCKIFKEHMEAIDEDSLREFVIEVCNANIESSNNLNYYYNLLRRCQSIKLEVTGKVVPTDSLDRKALIQLFEEICWKNI